MRELFSESSDKRSDATGGGQKRSEPPPPPANQDFTFGEKSLLVLSGLGDVILALIGGTQPKVWVSFIMLIVACGVQILVILKVRPFQESPFERAFSFWCGCGVNASLVGCSP